MSEQNATVEVGVNEKQASALPAPDDQRYFPKSFDEHINSHFYDGGINLASYQSYMHTEIQRGRDIARLLESVTTIRGKHVLDIGCGYGGLMIVMKEAGAGTISGVEVDTNRLKWAKVRMESLGYEADLRDLDICGTEASEQLGTYDIILAQDVIEHVPDPRLTIERIATLLQPGGVVYMQVGNKYSPDQLAGDHHYKLPGITMLSREQAIEYWHKRLHLPLDQYAVGYWREEKYYRNVFRRNGMKLQRMDRFAHPDHVLWYAKAITELLKSLEGNPWPDLRPELGKRIRHRILKVAQMYLRASQQISKLADQPELLGEVCDATTGRLLTGVLRFVGTFDGVKPGLLESRKREPARSSKSNEKRQQANRSFEAGQYEEALAVLREMLAENESSEVWNDLAAAHFNAGRTEEAEAGFRIALQIDPNDAQAALNLGALLFKNKRRVEARSFLQIAEVSGNASKRDSARALLASVPPQSEMPAWHDAVKLEEYLRKFVSDDPNEQSYFETHINRYIATLQHLPEGAPSSRLLELGAAFHHLTPALIHCKKYDQICCTDVWTGEAQQIRRIVSNGGDERFSFGVDNFDVQQQPWRYESESFDAVLCCEMLEHLHTDPMGFLAEINRVLKPGGFLFLTTPNLASAHAVEETMRGGSPYVYGKFEIGGRETDRHNREYTAGEVERLALAAGFEIEVLRTLDFYWPAKREILRTLAAQGHSIARRGDDTFLLARKRGPAKDRYPDEFYAQVGVQGERRAPKASNTKACEKVEVEVPVERNILLVHEILPHFDCSGADLRLYELVRELRKQGHRVTLLARSGRNADRYTSPLEALGVSVVADDPERLRHVGDDRATQWNLKALLERERFDVAILSHWFWSGISVVEHYLNEIRQWSPETRVLVLSEDRHGERERRSFHLTGLLSDLERGNDYEQREIEIYRQADLVLYVTETDHRHFLSLLPDLPTEHLPTIAESGTPGGAFNERDGLLFLGNFENLANRDGVRWFLEEVWPVLRKEEPELKLYIAGSGGGEELVKGQPNVVFLGKVDELAPVFALRRVFVAPVRYGTGIITKNMIALAHGLPVATTTVGAEGMQLVHGEHAMIADSPREFASSILRLYRDAALWESISNKGRNYISWTFSLEKLQSQIRKIVKRAVDLKPKRGDAIQTWSYRAVEQTHPEVLTQRPTHHRNMLRTFAYWQAGRQHLDAGRAQEALEQFRHIFTTLRGKVPATALHTQVLNDMARAYKELGDTDSAVRCELEMRNLSPVGETRIPSEPHRSHIKKGSKKNAPEISVVLPTYNRAEKLRVCLAALAFQSLPAHRWEVIVVDDGSCDATESICRDPLPFASFRYFRQDNSGAGAARRKGVAEAAGEFLFFCNDDTIAAPNLLAEHLSVHRQSRNPKLAVLGDFQPTEDCNRRALSMWVNWSPFLFPQRNMKPGELCGTGHFVTCNTSIRRAEVLNAGSFDPSYRVGEDTELGARLERRGLRVLYHPPASAWHNHPEFTTKDLIHRAQIYGEVTWALYQKHSWLLGEGKGFFGRLTDADLARIHAVIEEKRQGVATAVAGLEALDKIDFLPMLSDTASEGRKDQEVLDLLRRVVPMVFWNYFCESFLDAGKKSQEGEETPAASELQVGAMQ